MKVMIALLNGTNFSINHPPSLWCPNKIERIELESAKWYLTDLKKRYCSDWVTIDKTIPQCSKCHLRDGHSRRRCLWGDCQDPESCSDVDKHPNVAWRIGGLSFKREWNTKKKKIANKMSAISETQSSFKYRFMSTLINTNLEKRALRQTSINNDFYILEKHYIG